MKRSASLLFTFCLFCLLFALKTSGQDLTTLERAVLHNDSLFWKAYNACDVETMESFFTEDLEFYHDRAGVTTSRKKFMESVRAGLCGNPAMRIRREPLEESILVFPLENFGAVMSGQHMFYVVEKGKPDRLDGFARFTHVWKLSGNEWQMHRILSYDHVAPK